MRDANGPFKLTIEAELQNLSVIADFISASMEQMGISKEEHGVQTAVGEACTNVMKYAYSGKGGLITLTCEMKDHSFVVVINDQGKPFDPNSIPPPDLDASLEKRRIGGLGLYLMKKYMDEVTYSFKEDTGNTLVMKKMLTGKKQGP